jgi:hypothetical protein
MGMTFSASDAAVEGFRVIRREPGLLAVGALVNLVMSLALIAFARPGMRAVMAQGASSNPASVGPEYWSAFAGFFSALLVYDIIFNGVMACAVYRSILRPGDKGYARLRLGADELRMMALYVLLALVFLLAYVAIIVLAIVLTGALFAVAGAPNGKAPAVLVFVALMLGTFAALIWLAVRLSLAAPMTFAEKRLRLFASWRLTHGQFWPLVGCYLVALALIVALSMVSMTVQLAAGLAMAGGSIQGAADFIFHPDLSSLQAYLTPFRVVYMVLAAPIGASIAVVMLAPAAAAYRAIVQPDS